MVPARHDCIIIGAGPGGLQAAIHLARYNRKVLLIDRGGGRTRHAVHVENYLGWKLISGKKLVDIGMEQISHFGVDVERDQVITVSRKEDFEVRTKRDTFRAPFVIASSGATENIPPIKHLSRFFAKSIFTCVDCDGYRTTGTKLLIIGRTFVAVRLAFGMKQMFTDDVSLLLVGYVPSEEDGEALAEEGIHFCSGDPEEFLGEDRLQGLKLKDGSVIECGTVMLSFGYRLNDEYLAGLDLERDGRGFKISAGHNNESSVSGLFVMGALRPGHAQAIIAAGQGAATAIEINQRLLAL